MDRRQFIILFGLGGMASYFPVLLASCSNQKNAVTTPTPVNNTGFTPVGTMTELAQKGEISQDQILVIPSPSDPKKIIAVNPSCPHAGCAVTWDKDQKNFICPCHNSQFAVDGKVLQGPAETPLAMYETKLEGEQILVKVTTS